MTPEEKAAQELSPWWRRAVVITMLIGFTVLILVSVLAYRDAPPIPEKVVSSSGETLLTGQDIMSGQEVFLKYGLMENGTVWGHGAYLGPDFSAAYLHTLGVDAAEAQSQKLFGRPMNQLTRGEQGTVEEEVRLLLKQNRYDPASKTLVFTGPEAASYQKQITNWAGYFSRPALNGGLKKKYISDPRELKQLTSFFAWAAWASVVNRPGKSQTYTNNFPYDTLVGNTPSGDAVLWSAISLITLLVGTGLVLFAFGKFDYLGWKGTAPAIHPHMLPGTGSESQKATIKYFLVVALLFLAQVLVGGATAHFRAEPGSFYGIDLNQVFPSNILRTWHLQLALFWIATAYVGGGLLLTRALGETEPKGQVFGINLLFWALVAVVAGSLLGNSSVSINSSATSGSGSDTRDGNTSTLDGAGRSCSPWDWCFGPFCCFEGLPPPCATRNAGRSPGFSCSRP